MDLINPPPPLPKDTQLDMIVEGLKEWVRAWNEELIVTREALNNETCFCYLISYKCVKGRPIIELSEDRIDKKIVVKTEYFEWATIYQCDRDQKR